MKEFSYQKLKKSFLAAGLEDRAIAHILEEIKILYTIRREGLPEKVWTEEEVSAYTAFYLPTNARKFDFLMDQLDPNTLEGLSQCEVIDFGTGPGTYLYAFLNYFGGESCGHLWGIDKEENMLLQAEKVINAFYPEFNKKLHWQKEREVSQSTRDRLLIFGNSCNEMSLSQIKEIVSFYSPKFILFLEPGVPTVFDALMELRPWLVKEGFDCNYPCPDMVQMCPVNKRVQAGLEDWCHQVWRGTHGPEVERIGQMAKLDRKAMAFIGHLYQKKSDSSGSLKSKVDARFIRYLNESKHAYLWEVCLLHDDELQIKTFEIPKKSMNKEMSKSFKKLSVGQNFSYQLVKELGDGSWRVKVGLEN
ncbi:MAG: small ribosomal subunit Rsm22 family protein [Bacteriovoracaceae bacterium]|nr:small ribosomal subunit Rsm22 family protein [Bacteriovoracaceae bacterium]